LLGSARIAARLNLCTNAGADAYTIETAGESGSVYLVAPGQGKNFYNALLHATTGIISLLENIPAATLAQIDLGSN